MPSRDPIKVPETGRRQALGLSRALMIALFGLVIGQIVWRQAPTTGWRWVHRAEIAATSPAVSPAVCAVDSRGKRLMLGAPPMRIVSLSPGTTEMLFALDLKGRIVADTTYCDYPPEAKSLPKIGDVNTSIEKVLAQKPDLVVADAVANRRAVEPLEQLRVPVFTVPQGNVGQTYDALRSLGRATGQTSQAEHLVKAMQARVNAVRVAAERDQKRPRVLAIVQMEPLMVVGGGNFMDDLITLAGGINVGRGAGIGWAAYSPEKVVADQPDVILTGRSEAAQIRARGGWSGIPAVRNGAVYMVRTETVRPGPRMIDAFEEIARLLHPASFPARR